MVAPTARLRRVGAHADRSRCVRIWEAILLAGDLGWVAADPTRRLQSRDDGRLHAARVEPVARPVAGQIEVGEPGPFTVEPVLGAAGDGEHVALGRIDIGAPELSVQPRGALGIAGIDE